LGVAARVQSAAEHVHRLVEVDPQFDRIGWSNL
jgi:hypothetical protein